MLYSRLPGHTHEDIDAAFGVIWKWFRQKPCETLEDYKTGIEKAFQDKKNTSINLRCVRNSQLY